MLLFTKYKCTWPAAVSMLLLIRSSSDETKKRFWIIASINLILASLASNVQYKNVLAMIFNEIKCHVNTSLGPVGGCIPCTPLVSWASNVQYKKFLAMIFNEIKCHVNTSLCLVGEMHPRHPPCVRAWWLNPLHHCLASHGVKNQSLYVGVYC